AGPCDLGGGQVLVDPVTGVEGGGQEVELADQRLLEPYLRPLDDDPVDGELGEEGTRPELPARGDVLEGVPEGPVPIPRGGQPHPVGSHARGVDEPVPEAGAGPGVAG